MSNQHITEEKSTQEAGIVVPLELEGLRILKQAVQADGTTEVEGKNNRTKALMRQGYGYRNRSHLRLRILLEVA